MRRDVLTIIVLAAAFLTTTTLASLASGNPDGDGGTMLGLGVAFLLWGWALHGWRKAHR